MGRNEFAEDAWNFELWLYEQPGVSQCCLSLQFRYDVDVVLLLLSAWLGMKGCVLNKAEIREAITQIAPWRSAIVKCVRGVRYNFESLRYPKDLELSQLYEEIKLCELRAERIELFLLIDNLYLRLSSTQKAISTKKIIESNLLTYLAELITDSKRLKEEIAPIMSACTPYKGTVQADFASAEISAERSARTKYVNADLGARIGAFLDENYVMSLATFGPSGVHATNLLYARDKLSLIWVSKTGTKHSQNIKSYKQVAATVAASTGDFSAIRGIQIHGAVRRKHRDNDESRLIGLLENKYPALGWRANNSNAVNRSLQRAEVYLLEPTSIALIDGTNTINYKEIVEL